MRSVFGLPLVRARSIRSVIAMALTVIAAAAWTSSAAAAEPWWHVDVVAAPTNLPPENEKEHKFEEAQVEITATNIGDATLSSGVVTLSDLLPEKLKVVKMEAKTARGAFPNPGEGKMDCLGVKKGEISEEETEQQFLERRVKKADEKQANGEPIECEYTEHKLAPFEALVIKFTVLVEEPAGAKTELPDSATVTVKGGAGPETTPYKTNLRVDPTPTPFGVSRFELKPEEEGGGAPSLAGSHPFQITNTLNLNLTREKNHVSKTGAPLPSLPALPRDFKFKLPPGLLGNPTAVPRCTEAQFAALNNFINQCPADSVIGAAVVHVNEPRALGELTLAVPVFNLTPAVGEPARFGFFAAHAVVFIQTAISGEEEYAAKVTVHNATEVAEVLNTVVTLWGNPDNEVHKTARGWQCIEGEQHDETELEGKHCEGLGPTEANEEVRNRPFLIFPTTCSKEPLDASVEGDSWPVPGAENGLQIEALHSTLVQEIEGCNALKFEPSLNILPDETTIPGNPNTTIGSTPTGLLTEVHVPQTGTVSETGLATSAVRETTVTLPPGVLLNPGAATGLQVCRPGEVGVKEGFESEQAITTNNGFSFGPGPFACGVEQAPGANTGAKVGTLTIETPLLETETKLEAETYCEPGERRCKKKIEGAVYLGSQDTNPFEPPLVLYLIVNDPKDGIFVKLAGSVAPNTDPSRGPLGQLTSTFKNTPEVPFEVLKLHFFGGGRASVSTPGPCGPYTTTSLFTPWAQGVEQKSPQATFEVSTGPNGMSCTPPLPLSPSLKVGTVNPPGGTTQAAAFSPYSTTISRPDGDQAISGLNVTLPKGVAGVLANVTPCPEPQAESGQCGEASLIGHATTVSGLGPEPFTLHGGNVYLTVGYNGAPFGLSIVFPNIVAGPFAIGTVVVRSSIFVDESTAQVTIKSSVPTFVETVPHVQKGVPVQLKETNVETFGTLPDGKGFQFNPTNCSPLAATASFTGDEGGTSSASWPIQFTGCEKLSFHPGFEAEVQGQGSKPNGVSFKVITTSQGIGVANIARVHVALPIQLPSRLTTIQKACLAKVFSENPASCPEGSNIGSAHIETPVLKNPLSGPAYLVSHGSAEFPDVEFVLQGEGLKLLLDGKTDIKKGVTFSTFESTPDAPFTRFETTLPAGPHSALTANVPESKHFNLCAEKLNMPTELTSQSGTLIKQTTHIKITGCKPTIKIVKAKLSRRNIALSLNLSEPGTVTVSGSGLKKLRKALRAGTSTVKVALSKAGLRARKHRKKITIHVSLKATSGTAAASKPLRL